MVIHHGLIATKKKLDSSWFDRNEEEAKDEEAKDEEAKDEEAGDGLLKHQASLSGHLDVGKQGKERVCGPKTGCLLAVKERDIGDHVSCLIHGQIHGSLWLPQIITSHSSPQIQAIRCLAGSLPSRRRCFEAMVVLVGDGLLKHQASLSGYVDVGKQGKERVCGPKTGCLLAVKERDIGDHVSCLIHGQIHGSLWVTNKKPAFTLTSLN
ncbi:hypothetical protein YC2023_082242 [Brassica napus]